MPTGSPHRDAEGAGASRLGVGTRLRAAWLWAALALALLGAGWWYAVHPAPLPRGNALSMTTPPGAPLHIGVLSVEEREIEIRSVSWPAEAVDGAEVVALVCRGGAVGVTRDVEPFCDSVVPAEGATVGSGDQLVLRVGSDSPATIDLDGVRVAYREGWQWGEQLAGPDIEVRVGSS